jgi:flavin-dependent dehydrogenase
MYDIAIVGAGPAGATLARMLGDRFRVLLVDRRDLGEPMTAGADKTCGGLLAPAAQKALARQGLGVPRSVLSGPQLFAVRTVDLPSGLEGLYQRHYLNIDRERFDRWLVSLVDPHVERWFGRSLTSLERDGDGFVLRFRPRLGAPSTARAGLVVGADGAASLVRREVYGGLTAPTRYVAIQGVFDTKPTGHPYYGSAFDPELTDFYGWTIPKGDTLLVGLAVRASAGSTAEHFDEFVSRARKAGFSIGAERSRSAAAIARPTDPRQLLAGHGDALLIGEAGGFVSPSSAEGISYALRTASLLARALGPGLEGAAERYARAVRAVSLDVTLRMGKAAAIGTPASRRFLLRTGLDAVGDEREWRLPSLRPVTQ